MAGRVYKGVLARPRTFKEKLFQGIVDFVEEVNARFSVHGNPPVYDKRLFPWVKELEENWHLIRAELDKVLRRKDELPAFHELVPEVGRITQDKNWKTFLFCGYGRWSQRNTEMCPETTRLLRRIPGIRTAFFSILEPGKYIPPHRGPYNGVLRLHLGLIVPEPKERCWIRVDNQKLYWEEGKALIFDDCFDHEVHNNTNGLRAVLFVDFVRPTYFPANLLNWLLLNIAYFIPYVTEAEERERAWEQLFYEKAKKS
ncbi:MAG: aspartyl/asparaginyl beta-hydroxylase domain-containing protein [Bacteroidia bacterium]|nr:aspartyl/asparaginyl beta-hydroxylase domain-containing protein [Bacteroidia bacterium]